MEFNNAPISSDPARFEAKASANGTVNALPEQVSHPTFKIDEYAKDYLSTSKVQRMLYIAKRCPEVRDRALKIAMNYVNGAEVCDMRLYRETVAVAQKLGSSAKQDVDRIARVQETNSVKKAKLEDEIHKWRNLSHRDNTRQAYIISAKFHSECGEYDRALNKLLEAREYFTTQEDLLTLNTEISIASIREGNMRHLPRECANGLENVKATNEQRARFNAFQGLYYMKYGNFGLAANHFLAIAYNCMGRFEELSRRDVAVYGGLCALASFHRGDLKNQVLSNDAWKKFLDLAPRVKALITGLHESRYDVVMTSLAVLKKDLLLDMYLAEKVENLFMEIRAKALIQYLTPYSTMDLNRLNKDFQAEMENQLEKCVKKNLIAVKIDLHKRVIYAVKEQPRAEVLKQAEEVGRKYIRETRATLIRMEMQAMGISISRKGDDDFTDEEMEPGRGTGGIRGLMGGVFSNVMGARGSGGQRSKGKARKNMRL